jgi:hypothetical protein
MKTLISFFAAFVLFTVAAQSQTGLNYLPGDPTATLIATMPIVTNVTVDFNGKKKGENVQTEIMVWRTSSGGTQFTVNTPTIAPMTGTDIDYLPTTEIFRQVSTNAVREGALRGYFPPVGTESTKVWYESNVERTGSGLTTRFAACSSWVPVARDYTVDFNNGSPIVTDLTTTTYPNGCGAALPTVQ